MGSFDTPENKFVGKNIMDFSFHTVLLMNAGCYMGRFGFIFSGFVLRPNENQKGEIKAENQHQH